MWYVASRFVVREVISSCCSIFSGGYDLPHSSSSPNFKLLVIYLDLEIKVAVVIFGLFGLCIMRVFNGRTLS